MMNTLLKTKLFLLLVCLLFVHQALKAQESLSGVINKYASVTSIEHQGCESNIMVESTDDLIIGDRVIVIQMKGAIVDSTNSSNFGNVLNINNAGNFEIATIKKVSESRLTTTALRLNYSVDIGCVQIVSFPSYAEAIVEGTLNCLPWNGKTGGVLALEVIGKLTLKSDVSVAGKGFRGGSVSNNPDGSCGNGSTSYVYPLVQSALQWSLNGGGAEKGEGVCRFSSSKLAGKGSLANGGGGGNKHNHGGGGGGNFTAGGKGGNALVGCSNSTNGGLGGRFLVPTFSKIFMGGGGGCGDDNNRVGTKGENGGGIILIKSGTLDASGYKISANGNNQTKNGFGIADGAGGGGAGGSVFLSIDRLEGSGIIEANGGKGGSQEPTYGCVGPGGGGGGGVIMSTRNLDYSNYTILVQPGKAGKFLTSGMSCAGTTYGAEDGNIGVDEVILMENWIVGDNSNLVTSNKKDTFICEGNDIYLKLTKNRSDLVWSTGSQQDSIFVSEEGVYWCRYSVDDCTYIDSFYVSVYSSMNIDLDTIICDAAPVTYQVRGDFDSLLWSDGDRSRIKYFTQTSNLGLFTYLKGCSFYNSVDVSILDKPDFSISGDTFICQGQTTKLNVNSIALDFVWDDNSTSTVREIDTAGMYYVRYSLLDCDYKDSVFVYEVLVPKIKLPNDSIICKGDTILLEASQNFFCIPLFVPLNKNV